MLKKVVIVLIVIVLVVIVIFKINKKEEIKENNNINKISILLETEEGNIKTNNFPSKEEYSFDKIDCTNLNTSTNITPSFNKDTWKLNVSASSTEKLDGNFECNIYFKEIKLATEAIISKYSENNDDGLIKIEQPVTSQTPELTEYRYSGSNEAVKNYVKFNNELWRIIGVFEVDDGSGNYEQRIKIIRDEPIGGYSWDTSEESINLGYGINQWGESGSYEGTDLMKLLNPGYENDNINNSLYWNGKSGTCYSTINNGIKLCNFSNSGLNEEAKAMISEAKWYTAAIYRNITTSNAYKNERGTTIGMSDNGISVTKTYSWIGKVGLMYPSDVGLIFHKPLKI